MKGYQFVWSWRPSFSFKRFDPTATSWAYIYEWSLRIGFLIIRKWSTRKLPIETRRRNEMSDEKARATARKPLSRAWEAENMTRQGGETR